MKEKDKFSIVITLLITAVVVFFMVSLYGILVAYSLESLFGKTDTLSTKTIHTNENYKFVLVEKTFFFHKQEYYFEIYNENQYGYIKVFNNKHSTNLEFTCIYKSKDLICYSFLEEIIYKKEPNIKFENIALVAFPNLKPEGHEFFVPVAKHLTSQNDWKWVKVFSEFLLKSSDEATIKQMQRYAKGIFINDEVSKNAGNGIYKDEIQKFSKELLTKYNLLAG